MDKWKLTESRDDVLRAWREQGVSNVINQTFLAEHLPLPGKDDGVDEDMDMKLVEADSPVELENIPAAPSLGASSSLSSSDSMLPILKAVPPLQLEKGSIPKSVTSLGTLTDSRNVYTTRGLRRGRS